jgi:dihydrofolate reductase
MTTGHVFIATSLDGFIARPHGGLDWLIKQRTAGEDHGFDTMMESVDGLIMGRRTFQDVLCYDDWPYRKPVVVMSRSLSEADIPEELQGRVRISELTPERIMQQLDSEGWARAYVDGGALIRSFLRAGLIADMVLTRIPILIGSGRPLFGDLDHDIDLEHVETRDFPSGLVRSTYQIQS